jgi:transcriptional regulator with XRE-family HTH domain
LNKSQEEKWLKEFGNNLKKIILEKGYQSPYDFWIKKASEEFARSYINNLLIGKRNPKATSLITLAKLLKIDVSALLSFKNSSSK